MEHYAGVAGDQNFFLVVEICPTLAGDLDVVANQPDGLVAAGDLLADRDFSERLLALVGSIVARRSLMGSVSTTAEVTELVYGQDIRALSDALSAYVVTSRKEAIWVLVDNLDKGWSLHRDRTEDILLIRSLLEASRKLQRPFENRGRDRPEVR